MRFLAAALVALALSSCVPGDPTGATIELPLISPLVVNSPDSFSMVPMGLVFTGTRDYDWSCSASQANLTIAGITGGSIRIRIEDADGAVVHDNLYDGGLMGAITAVTSPDGAPGLWKLAFTFQNVLAVGAIEIEADSFHDPDEIVVAGSYSLHSSFTFDVGWPAGPAEVTIASAISAGVVRVRIWDGDGVLVLDKTNLAVFIGAFDGSSNPGAAGTWRVQLDISAVATAGAITLAHP
jgi:hypothetical protein